MVEKFMIGFKSGFVMSLNLVSGQQLILDIVEGINSNLNAPIQIYVENNVFINTTEVEFIVPETIAYNPPLHRTGRVGV